MKVIEFLELADENSNCYIVNTDGEMLSVYDGRNSIDTKFNDMYIEKIYPTNSAFTLVVNEWQEASHERTHFNNWAF